MASSGTTLRHSARLPEMSRVFADEPEPAAGQVTA